MLKQIPYLSLFLTLTAASFSSPVLAGQGQKRAAEEVNRPKRPYGSGLTPIQLATLQENEETIWQLAQQGEDIHAPIAEGVLAEGPLAELECWTPFQIAVRLGQPEVVFTLAMLGADLDEPVDSYDEDRFDSFTPLHIAAFCGHEHVVRLLAALGADVRGIDGTFTPSQIALLEGHDNVVKTLSECGANVRWMNPESSMFGWTFLQIASSYGQLDVVRKLLALGEDPNAVFARPQYSDERDPTGWTLLQLVTYQGIRML